MKRILSLFIALALVLVLGVFLPDGALLADAVSYEPAGFEFSGRIVLVGDSTVCDYNKDWQTTYGRFGWGMKLAAENSIPLIDMTTKTVDLYNELYQNGGGDAARKMHCYTDAAKTMLDRTHLSEYGAAAIASIIAKGNTAQPLYVSHAV